MLLKKDSRKVFQSTRVLIKFIKGMQLVDWFCSHFSPESTLIILRHPGAVVSSQLLYMKGKEAQFFHHSIHARNHRRPVTLIHKGKNWYFLRLSRSWPTPTLLEQKKP
ncbi:hypothetical protein KFE98_11430 [bacterium SCSIO 12741]|nr:hypothetical protein KFE98_11430 [bacterium SCSIO 12741]